VSRWRGSSDGGGGRGDDHFIVRNSWGTSEWGDKGFGYASTAYTHAAFTEAYGITV
jgi:C1A family cysteine protease